MQCALKAVNARHPDGIKLTQQSARQIETVYLKNHDFRHYVANAIFW